MSSLFWYIILFYFLLNSYKCCPTGYIQCASTEGESCNLSGDNIIAYGHDDYRWAYKQVTGNFVCNNALFPTDPVTETTKNCCYQNPKLTNIPILGGVTYSWLAGQMPCNKMIYGYTSTNSDTHIWRFTAPTTTTVTFSNCLSAGDTQMHLYTSNGQSQMASISGCENGDDCACLGKHEQFEWAVTAGNDYYIRILPYDNGGTDYGEYQLTITCNQIATCQNNIIVGKTTQTNRLAYIEVVTQSKWDITFATCDSEFHGSLRIYNDSEHNDKLIGIGGNHNNCGTYDETYTLNAAEANTFYVEIDDTSTCSNCYGAYILTITCSGSYPTFEPTPIPTDSTNYPTINPTTNNPTTINPTTINPTTINPTTKNPTTYPTVNPTSYPSINPTSYPSINPTTYPTVNPTINPTTINPTTKNPTKMPSKIPSVNPTVTPTERPTDSPTKEGEANNDLLTTQIKNHESNKNGNIDDEKSFFVDNFVLLVIGLSGLICLTMCLLIICVVGYKRKMNQKQRVNIDSSDPEAPQMNLAESGMDMAVTQTKITNGFGINGLNNGNNGEIIEMQKVGMNAVDCYSDSFALKMWLQSFGMVQYFDLFNNRYNTTQLKGLNDSNLKEIGIINVEHRQIILDHIANNSNVCGEGFRNINSTDNLPILPNDDNDTDSENDELFIITGNHAKLTMGNDVVTPEDMVNNDNLLDEENNERDEDYQLYTNGNITKN